MRRVKEALLTFLEAMTVGGGLLLVPCILADLTFGWVLTAFIAPVVLGAAVSTALLTWLAIHEGWYTDHLSRLAGANMQTPPPGKHGESQAWRPGAVSRRPPRDFTRGQGTKPPARRCRHRCMVIT